MARTWSALVRSLVGWAALASGFGCAHPPPRGPVATTKKAATPGATTTCGDARAPYLAELCAMDEPPLTVAGPEAYRFVWLRQLHNPVAVRIMRAPAGGDGEVAIVSVEADARDPSKQRRHELTASGDVWRSLRAHLAAADFWNLAGDPEDDERGLDGADWVIEGRRGGVYHAVVRWEPKPGPFRDACEDLIGASGLSFPAEIQ